jgi:hypothetical protein
VRSLRGAFGLGAPPRLPPEVRAALGRERSLAAAQAEDGAWVVGTRDRLHVVGEHGRSWPWEEVLRADWDEEARLLEVVPVGDYGRPVERRSFVLQDAADLLTLIRERVSASVLLQRSVAVTGKRGFRLFARRPPRGGAITWAFEMDPGVDPDDPVVRRAMDEALADAQTSVWVVED